MEVMQHMQFVFWLVTCTTADEDSSSSFEASGAVLAPHEISRHVLIIGAVVRRCDTLWSTLNSDSVGDRSARKSSSRAVLHFDGCVLSVICLGQQIRRTGDGF